MGVGSVQSVQSPLAQVQGRQGLLGAAQRTAVVPDVSAPTDREPGSVPRDAPPETREPAAAAGRLWREAERDMRREDRGF